jgi:serine/threonine protein kinase
LHREGIAHGDIKPSNVLLKLIDVGPAVDLNSPSARRLRSPAYAAPEVLDGAESTLRLEKRHFIAAGWAIPAAPPAASCGRSTSTALKRKGTDRARY